VMPALADNQPYALLECLLHGIPFLTSSVGGIPEVLTDETLRRHLTFVPTARGLFRCLDDYLRASPTERQAWRERARTLIDPAAWNRNFVEEYERIADCKSAICNPQS